MPTDHSAGGPGERLVRMLACVQRETDRVESVLPSVDHLALRRRCVDTAAIDSELRGQGPEAILEPFESWRKLVADFDDAARRLTVLRDTRIGDPGYQSRLGAAIEEARNCRQAVEEATADLQRRVAALIDAALARQVSI